SIAYTMTVLGYAYWEQNESGGYTGALTAKNGKTYDMKQTLPVCDDLFSLLCDEYGSPRALAEGDGYEISFGDVAREVFGASYEYFFLVEHQYTSSAQSVSGIKKTGMYSLSVTLDSYDFEDIYAFSFYIAPLHVYGSREEYKYTESRFGFTKGDLREIRDVKSTVGSGAFLYKGESDGTLKLQRNKLYFLGCPYISYVELVSSGDTDVASGIADGTFDIAMTELDGAMLASIKGQNSNGELDGDVVSSILRPNGLYGYIGLNCDLMKVGDDKMSDASVALRYAFCSVLSYFAPSSVSGYFGQGAMLGSYPLDRVVYSAAEEIELYNISLGGERIYTSEMTETERRSALRAAVLEYFVAAGYSLDRRARKVERAPEGASLEFDFWLCTATDSAAASIAAVRDMAEEMGTLGIVVNIVEVSDVSELEAALRFGECDMWAYEYELEREPQLSLRYHSSASSGALGYENYTRFSDRDADALIESIGGLSAQEERLRTYSDCFDLVYGAGAELSLFIRYDATLISAQRTAKDTPLSDITDYWNWYNVLSALKLK
ncbi:MAG: hypothetical protein IJE84_06195, partial [Clostridia bacterium]|nr:hypothetical protein [Clostridia bacterium]